MATTRSGPSSDAKCAPKLWNSIRASGMRTLSVMGMSKNTGKTVVLNHLLAHAAADHLVIGLSSIGRDGEDRDQVFMHPKPPILVWPGTLVATARETLHRAKVEWKLIASTGLDSPMGEILIVKVSSYGEMEVAGSSRGHDQLSLIALLRQCGASLVILDGALGRSHHASPAIADGVILATGAAIGGGMGDVLRKTRDRLGILGIAQADADHRTRCAAVFADGGVGLWDQAGQLLFHEQIATLNASTTLEKFYTAKVATIAVSGAVGRSLWQALRKMAELHPGLQVVVADGTKLFVDHTDLLSFQKLGAHIVAYRAIQLCAITLNPISPQGGSFEAEAFLHAAQEMFSAYTVSDVMLSEQLKETGVSP